MTVKLVWVTPDADKLVAFCARVSNPSNQDNEDVASPKFLETLAVQGIKLHTEFALRQHTFDRKQTSKTRWEHPAGDDRLLRRSNSWIARCRRCAQVIYTK